MTWPGGIDRTPWNWDYYESASWTTQVVGPATPLQLFSPATDARRLAFTRIGDAGRRGLFRLGLSPVTGQQTFHFELPVDGAGNGLPDYTASLVVQDRVTARQETIAGARAVRMRLRGLGPDQQLHVTLMEHDGTSWTTAVTVDSTWTEVTVPLADFTVGRGALSPQGFPGSGTTGWDRPRAGGSTGDRVRPEHLERLQLSLRGKGPGPAAGSYGVEVEWVSLTF